MRERVIVKKEDWEIEAMPAETESFIMKLKFTRDEIENLRYGFIPEEMEDRWFAYMEGNTMYIYRSWTGTCVFIVEIDEKKGEHKVTYNCNKDQVNFADQKEAEEEVAGLLTWWAK